MGNSKMNARERIDYLFDDHSFVEVGGYVSARNTDYNLGAKKVEGDGVITGYGVINDRMVYVYSQDASALGGSVGEMHAKKIASLYDLAMKTGAPIIGMLDCAGLRLQEATDALHAFGTIFNKQAQASGMIPQISAVFGMCGGGSAVMSAMSDFTLMEKENGSLFINSPNALAGNEESRQNTAGAQFQSEQAGNVDFVCETEEALLDQLRILVDVLPSDYEAEDVYFDNDDDLNRVIPELNDAAYDAAYILKSISDNNMYIETKAAYAKEMVTAFIRLNGETVGAVANRTKVYDDDMNVAAEFDAKLTAKGCNKAAEFVNFCDAFNIPVLTLTNVNGFAATMCQEKNGAKASSKLVYAFANATVPKVNLIIGDAIGSAYVTMNSKATGADIVYAWPTAKVGMMEAKSAVEIMYADEIANGDANQVINEKVAEYQNLQGSVMAAAARGYVDSIVEPVDTRKYLIGAFEMLYTKFEERPGKKHGTV